MMMVGLRWWFRPGFMPKRKEQSVASDPSRRRAIREKLRTVREKGYLEHGVITAIMFFFDVPKGTDDVRMVYDGTASGLNDYLWAPWFMLPTVESLLRALEPGTWMGDNDCGEMFLNFVLHEDVRRLCGVDLSGYFPAERQGEKLQMRWCRPAMGLKPSGYTAVKGIRWAEEDIRGDHNDERNVFAWARVELNLPGSRTYNPSVAWVRKVRKDGRVAADLFTYVDDIRPTGPTEREAWRAQQRVSSQLALKGLQDAPRKRRRPDQEPGPWAGSVAHSTGGEVSVLVTQARWDKTKAIVGEIAEKVSSGQPLEHKRLESQRGFLIYIMRTYPAMRPYLKGIHATLDSWRPGRDADGWRLGKRKRDSPPNDCGSSLVDAEDDPWEAEQKCRWTCEPLATDNPPKLVTAVPRLGSDVAALQKLTEEPRPVKRLVRPRTRVTVRYGFGDASKPGFGASVLVQGRGILWQSGTWNWSIREETSSNYKELLNLVEFMEAGAKEGIFENAEVWMFTDNSTAEACYFRGTSKSKPLFELVLRLRQLEMKTGCRVFLVHVAGARMIEQGSDALSRNDLNTGVMAGLDMLDFVPLHRSALDREPGLRQWVFSWAMELGGRSKVSFLSPHEWEEAHPTGGTFVWSPPPAAASAAVELLANSIHKRPGSIHVVLVPRLMTAWWYKLLNKAADVIVKVPTGVTAWNKCQHEPLICALCLPLSRKEPWRHKDTPRARRVLGSLQEVWDDDFGKSRDLLRQFLGEARDLASL